MLGVTVRCDREGYRVSKLQSIYIESCVESYIRNYRQSYVGRFKDVSGAIYILF